jgi:hypothetical protein
VRGDEELSLPLRLNSFKPAQLLTAAGPQSGLAVEK